MNASRPDFTCLLDTSPRHSPGIRAQQIQIILIISLLTLHPALTSPGVASSSHSLPPAHPHLGCSSPKSVESISLITLESASFSPPTPAPALVQATAVPPSWPSCPQYLLIRWLLHAQLTMLLPCLSRSPDPCYHQIKSMLLRLVLKVPKMWPCHPLLPPLPPPISRRCSRYRAVLKFDGQ